MYLPKNIVEGSRELTELQREVLFHTVINGESTESVAKDKNCSARNICDILTRVLNYLRSIATGGKRGDMSTAQLLVVIIAIAAVGLLVHFLLRPLFKKFVGVGCLFSLQIFRSLLSCHSKRKPQIKLSMDRSLMIWSLQPMICSPSLLISISNQLINNKN